MSILQRIIKVVARRKGLEEAYDFFDASNAVGQPSEVTIPKDLVPMAGRMLTRALFSQMVFEPNLDWVLPFWMEKQFKPGSNSFIPRMGRFQMNLTHRNWTGVGPLGGTCEGVVDPRGLVTPWLEGWSLDYWVAQGDRLTFPSRTEGVTQFLEDNLPFVHTVVPAGELTMESLVFGWENGGQHLLVVRVSLKNLSGDSRPARFFFSIRPYNPEGAFLIRELEYRHRLWSVNGSPACLLLEEPGRVSCSDLRAGDVSLQLDRLSDRREITCKAGMATGLAEYTLELEAGHTASFNCLLTLEPDRSEDRSVSSAKSYDFTRVKPQVKKQWLERVNSGMRIGLPDQRLQDSFDAQKTHLNTVDDGDSITPGPLTYHHYWFRDSAYMVTALNIAGYHEQAAQKLENYPSRQRPDGFFLSQDGEWDSAGQAIWTITEHYRFTEDRDLLEAMYSSIAKGAKWIEPKRKTTSDNPDAPHAGLLPPGFSAEHLGPNDYFYWDDFWCLAGLREAAFAADVLGRAGDRDLFMGMFDSFKRDIDRSLEKVQTRIGRPILPASPYRRMDAGAIGSVVALYPLRLVAPDDPRLVNTVEFIRERCFYKDGFFQAMTHAGINCYLTAHIAQCHLLARDRRAWELVRAMLDLASGTCCWPEAVHPTTGGGCMGDGHHTWAAADWLTLVRNLLLMENGDGLVITPILPRAWIAPGAEVTVQDAPTHFGPISYSIRTEGEYVVLNVDPRFRREPKTIEWCLPFEAETAEVDGWPRTVYARSIPFSAAARSIRVRK